MLVAADFVVMLAVPSWVWATLLTVLFVAVSIATMWLTRYPLRNPPRSDAPEQKSKDE